MMMSVQFLVDDEFIIIVGFLFKCRKFNEEPKRANVEVQTELHPVESNIDKNHTFSEWELKKRAVKIANLTKCQTKSQQTIRLKRDFGIQITPVMDKNVQTLTDKSCNHDHFSKAVWKLY